jgi:predicted nucleic acid-binding protein
VRVLVDSNVLLDIFTNDPDWAAWSAEQLAACAHSGLAINPIIYAELSPAFSAEGELEHALAGWPQWRFFCGALPP